MANFMGRLFPGQPQLISLQNPTSGTKVTYSSLDGNNDHAYWVRALVKGSAAAWLTVKPNDTAVSVVRQNLFTAGGNNSGEGLVGSANKTFTLNGYLFARTGAVRTFVGHMVGEDNGAASQYAGVCGWTWTDTSTNITSVAFELTAGAYVTGTSIELYRIRQS